MWLAIVLACSTPYAQSCIVFAKQEELFVTEELCKEETDRVTLMMQSQGMFARPACFKIGTNLQENKMKKLLLPVAFAAMTTSVSAMDLGYGLSVGAETELTYTTGKETWTLDVTPSVGLGAYGVSFSAETTIDVLDLNNGDIFTGVDWEAEYVWKGITTYTKVSSDADFEFGDITMGAKLSF